MEDTPREPFRANELLQSYLELARPTLERGRFPLMAKTIQHGKTTTLEHSAAVGFLSLATARALHLRVDEKSLVRGALLHDYFLYDWHDRAAAPDALHGFTHPAHALHNAEEDFDLVPAERDVISRHMFPFLPLPPRTREGWVVSVIDKACSAAETLLKRPYDRPEA